MKKSHIESCLLASLLFAGAAVAQDDSDSAPARPARPGRRPAAARAAGAGDYATDIATVGEAQQEVLDKARDMLDRSENPTQRNALETAVKNMEQSQKMLEAAKNSPDKLPAAVAAQQAAYQALLKTLGHDRRVQRGKSSGSGSSAGQASRQQMNELELTSQENRYETERQATAPQSQEQKDKLEIADRLKQLAQRQQDLNDRLRDLQTALQEARTEQEREEIQRQLKHLADDERQMLADMDELRQRMEQSPSASSLADARQQMEQARSDTQRAAQELQNQSPSQALAAGARAQQTMQNLRDNFRNQTSSQFAEQMRELRNQAREMDRQEGDVARELESLANSEHKTLDDSGPRQQLAEQMAKQQSALTNVLSKMQDLSQQAETSEPLLSQQLYDTLRKANQMHTDSSLQTSTQLLGRGFFSQASEAEHAARTNITQLRQSIEQAAESVLGNEADAIRYAQKELDDLARQVAQEVNGGAINSNRVGGARGQSNSLTSAEFQSGPPETNNLTGRTNNASGAGGSQLAENGSPNGQSRAGRQGQQGNGEGQQGQQASGASGRGSQPGAGQNPSQGQSGAGGSQGGSQAGSGQQQGQQQGGGNQPGAGSESASATEGSQGQGNASGNASGSANGSANGGANAGTGDTDRLRELARQFGGNNGANNGGAAAGGWGGPNGGPITGRDFVNWADRMRGVEQVLDSPDLRNQLATARERLATYRRLYIARGTKPDTNDVNVRILRPMTEVSVRLQEDLARLQDKHSLVPLDHDPVPDRYSELVRKYYEKLGGGQ